ncbi:MAG: zinc ribbon domain-containing protein [Acidobacteriia bacterium]|nr:zinc ribbon domain-containing protein [Terriglobia bacterium]
MYCPKCGFEQPEGGAECPRCGIVFARFEGAGPGPRAPGPAAAGSDVRPIDGDGWRALGIGAGAAIVVFLVPFTSFVFSYFLVLLHELGHAAAGWIFGYPSVPAFDFSYGGGVTMHQDRQAALVVLVYAAIALGGWLLRGRRVALAVLAAATALYSLLAWTRGHEAVVLFMGHGSELVFAGIFLHRALSGEGLVARAERPAYAFVAIFTLLFDVRFALRLLGSPLERAIYEEAKGGGHWMDFSRLADDYLHTSLGAVALLFLAACALPPLLAILAHRYRPRLEAVLARILEPSGAWTPSAN